MHTTRGHTKPKQLNTDRINPQLNGTEHATSSIRVTGNPVQVEAAARCFCCWCRCYNNQRRSFVRSLVFSSDNRGIKLNVYVVAPGNWHHCSASSSVRGAIMGPLPRDTALGEERSPPAQYTRSQKEALILMLRLVY